MKGTKSAWNGAWDIRESSEAGLTGKAWLWGGSLQEFIQKPGPSGFISEFPKLRLASHLSAPDILPFEAQLAVHLDFRLSWPVYLFLSITL